MNKVTIIGNLTRDPEMRVTQSGLSVCSFTVAVNRRSASAQGEREADFFRVTAWRALGENCNKYLKKGRKVCVIGPVSLNMYDGNDGQRRGSLEVTADDVEFLSTGESTGGTGRYEAPAQSPYAAEPAGMRAIEDDDLPF